MSHLTGPSVSFLSFGTLMYLCKYVYSFRLPENGERAVAYWQGTCPTSSKLVTCKELILLTHIYLS